MKSTATRIIIRITNFTLKLVLNTLFYTIVVMLIISISKKAYTFTYQIYGDVSVEEAPGRDIIFQIKKGESSMDISSKLEINRLIMDKNAFFLKAKLQKSNILPGTYKLNTSMNYNDILDNITNYSAAIIRDDIEE